MKYQHVYKRIAISFAMLLLLACGGDGYFVPSDIYSFDVDDNGSNDIRCLLPIGTKKNLAISIAAPNAVGESKLVINGNATGIACQRVKEPSVLIKKIMAETLNNGISSAIPSVLVPHGLSVASAPATTNSTLATSNGTFNYIVDGTHVSIENQKLSNGIRTADLSLLDGYETGEITFSPQNYPSSFSIKVIKGG